MPASLHKFESDKIMNTTQNWDKRIADDLVGEMKEILCEKADSFSEMREFLAIKGLRQLRDRVCAAIAGKRGHAALTAMAHASLAYSRERPGLSAATFKTPITESADKIRAAEAVRAVYAEVFAQCGYEGQAALYGARIMHSLVRGFVVNEMSESFIDAEETDEAFRLAIDVFIQGLPALNQVPMEV